MNSAEMQLGKNGITDNFIQTLKGNFERHGQVRVSVLQSAGHERDAIKKYSDDILAKLGNNYTAKLIGFKIIIKRWRKARDKE